jgi:hypothetical protein
MSSSALSALGSTLSWAGNIITDITKIGGVEITAAEQDVTTLACTFKEFISGIAEGGSIDIEGFLNPANTLGQIALKSAVGGALAETMITFSTALNAGWVFNAICTKFMTGDVDIEGGLPFSATIKITGEPIFSVASSAGLTTPYFSISESAIVTPSAANSVYKYDATVLTGVTSVTVTPTATTGVITVNGVIVATGAPSAAIILGAAGSTTIITIIVAETSKIPVTYIIKVFRGL